MSNLCQEITLPTDPIQSLQGQGEIALCILSAINVGKITKTSELENLCDLAVRGLEELIDYQGICQGSRGLYYCTSLTRYRLHWTSTLPC